MALIGTGTGTLVPEGSTHRPATDPAGDGANGEGTQPGDGSDPSSKAGLYTQADVEKLVEERLGRYKTRAAKERASQLAAERESAAKTALDLFRSEHGLDDDEALERWKNRGTSQEQEAQHKIRATTLEKKLKTTEAELTIEREARKTEAALLQKTLTHDALIRVASLYSNAPDIVAKMLSDRVRLDENHKPVVLDEDGEPTEMTIEKLVPAWLTSFPMLCKPSGSPGGGSRPASAGATPPARVDFAKAKPGERVAAITEFLAQRGSSR